MAAGRFEVADERIFTEKAPMHGQAKDALLVGLSRRCSHDAGGPGEIPKDSLLIGHIGNKDLEGHQARKNHSFILGALGSNFKESFDCFARECMNF